MKIMFGPAPARESVISSDDSACRDVVAEALNGVTERRTVVKPVSAVMWRLKRVP